MYTVNPSGSKGSRVNIVSLWDGTPFDGAAQYRVAMTSYRASGAGGLLAAAGLDRDMMSERIVEIYPEIRVMLCDFIENQGHIDPLRISSMKKTGSWRFVR